MAFNAGAIEATLTLDRTPFQRGLDEAKAEADRFGQGKFSATLGVDDADAKAKLTSFRGDLDRLATDRPTIHINVDLGGSEEQLGMLRASVGEQSGTTIVIKADVTQALTEIDRVKVSVDDLSTKAATIRVSADTSAATTGMAEVQAAVDRISTDSATIRVRADTAEAQAGLGVVAAQVSALNGKQVNISVDSSQLGQAGAAAAAAGGAADSAAGQFNAMAAGIMAAFPPASAAVLALPGALSLAIVPALALATGMTGIQAAAAPLAGEFLNLQSVVSATFEQGMKPAVADVSALLPTLQSGLVGTAGALSTVAQQVLQVVASKNGLADIQATFSNVDSIIIGMAPGVAGLTQNFLDLSALGSGSLGGLSTIINGLSTQWHDLITNLSGTGQAQGAISSLVGALGAVLALLPPLVQEGVQLMDVLGPPLVGALQLVGGALNLLSGPLGGVTTTVLAGVAAWKLLSAAVGSDFFQGMIAKATAASVAVSAYTTNVVANTAAESAAVAAGEAHAAAVATEASAIARAQFAQDAYVAALASGVGVEGAAAAATQARNNALVAAAASAEAKARADAAAAVAAETAAGGDTIYAQAAGRVAAANTAAATSSSESAAGASANAAATQAAAAAAAGATGAISAEATALAAAATAAEAEAVAVGQAAVVTAEGATAAAALATSLAAEAESAAIVASTATQAATVIAGLAGAQSEAAATAAATATALTAEAEAAAAAAVAAESDAAALAALAGSASRAAAATSVTAASMRAQAGAAATASAGNAAASASTAGFAGALGKLTPALLGIGVAAVVGYTAVKAFTTSTTDAVSALGLGGQAAANMKATLDEQTASADKAGKMTSVLGADIDNWIASNIFGVATTQSATEAFNAQREAMTPLQRAQQDATIAQGDYNKAVKDFTPNSAQAVDAQKKYAEATLAVTQAQAAAVVASTNVDASMQAASAHFGDVAQAADGAAQAAVSYANALATLADPMASAGDKTKAFAADIQGAADAPRNLLQVMDAADKSVTSFATSTIKISPAMIDATGAINTATKAGQELATGILGTAKAYDNLKGATIASSQAAGDDMVTSLAKGDVALETMRQKLIDTAVQHGATRDAAQKMVDTYLAIPPSVKTEIQQPGMVAALADALGLKDKITSVPDNKTIVVSSITAPVQKQLEDLGLTVTKLPNGQIIISANTDPALLKIAQAQAEAQKKEGIIPIDGDPAKFNTVLHDGVTAALTTTATMKLDANSAPAGLKRDLWKQDTNATNATAKMDADTKPASLKRDLWKAETQASPPPVITVDANTKPAGMKRDVWKQETNGTTAIASVDANTLPAGMKRDQWKAETQATVGVTNMDANPAQAVAKRDLWKSETQATTGTANLNANPAQAEGARVNWKNVADSTVAVMRANADISNAQAAINSFITMNNGRQINIIVTTTGSGGIASAGRLAEGGILRPMAEGGIIANDGGNMLTPLQGGIAATVAPNTWRIIGDNMHVPESYIPHDGSPRSKAILGQTAADMGYGLVPKGLMEALKASGPGGSDGAAAPAPQIAAPSGQGMGDVAAAVAQVASRLEALERSDSTALVAAKLDQVVAELRRGGAGAQIVVNDQSGSPVETARSTMLQLRMRR